MLMPEADETDILTVWSPLTPATIENGCLQVIPRSHRVGLLTHCADSGVRIPEPLLPADPVAVPMRAGSVLLMHRLTAHSALENQSGSIRFSFDLRYQHPDRPTGRPQLPGFLARSQARPDDVLRDVRLWHAGLEAARARLLQENKPTYFRWGSTDPICA